MAKKKFSGNLITEEQAKKCLQNYKDCRDKGLTIMFDACYIDGRALAAAMQKYDAYNLTELPMVNESGNADALFELSNDAGETVAYFNGVEWCPPFCGED